MMISTIYNQSYFKIGILFTSFFMIYIYHMMMINIFIQILYEFFKFILIFNLLLIVPLGFQIQRIKINTDNNNYFIYPLYFRTESRARQVEYTNPTVVNRTIAEPPQNPWTPRHNWDDNAVYRTWGNTN